MDSGWIKSPSLQGNILANTYIIIPHIKIIYKEERRGGRKVKRGDYRSMQSHFEELMLKLKADIYRDKVQSQYSHFMFGEYWV